jgi:hypothetical protein
MAALCVVLVMAMVASHGGRPLPERRMRFVASSNGGSSSFQPLADTFIRENASYNVSGCVQPIDARLSRSACSALGMQ